MKKVTLSREAEGQLIHFDCGFLPSIGKGHILYHRVPDPHIPDAEWIIFSGYVDTPTIRTDKGGRQYALVREPIPEHEKEGLRREVERAQNGVLYLPLFDDFPTPYRKRR